MRELPNGVICEAFDAETDTFIRLMDNSECWTLTIDKPAFEKLNGVSWFVMNGRVVFDYLNYDGKEQYHAATDEVQNAYVQAIGKMVVE